MPADPAAKSITREEIAAHLARFGVDLTGSAVELVGRWIDILLLWNQKLNLTSVSDPREIVDRHFGESMFAGAVIPLATGRLADVGSGAGFPGVALKILYPGLYVTLIEANTKKAAFLREVCRALDLVGVEIIRSRYEELRVKPGFVDFVAARAVGDIRKLLNWARGALGPRGRVLLWLGAEDANRVQRYGAWSWSQPALIPGSKRRVIICGELSLPK